MLAAALMGLAVIESITALEPKAAPTVVVVTAAHDLPAGEVLTTSDVVSTAVATADASSGAISSLAGAVGRQLSGPLRRGEQLTDVRLDDGPLSQPAAGLVAAPVRLADVQAADLLQPGQRVDVLAASTDVEPGGADASSEPTVGGTAAALAATVVAADVSVVAIPVAAVPSAGNGDDDVAVEGALVVLATTPRQAQLLAQAQVSARLSAVVVG
jgi:pilus assembly protein CpaB